ncbi:McrB family protein [Hydrogenimonas urashimensis]|uniref:McrB family protein n=1 Tax=Hydrogenimonas urashimensis TaxID=2740515 RepID=UPI0019156D72|nr:AAA family ATPase [Hydrogenimonas urashimensis]
MKNSITENHIKDVYEKFKNYIEENGINVINTKTQAHIVDKIKETVKKDSDHNWNESSLKIYLNNLIYMLKGEKFTQTINNDAKKYFIESICNDFDENYCENAKKSLEEHEKYYENISTNKNKIKNSMKKFRENPNDFDVPLSVKWYFSINQDASQYPVKAIYKDAIDQSSDLTVEQIKRRLVDIFGEKNINFFTLENKDNNDFERNGKHYFIQKNKLNYINNIILYGPPGVGKTHNIKQLIQLIEEGKSEWEIFDIITSNDHYDLPDFDESLNNRIRFVTFHQSYGYEDFVEGFRPNNEGKIVLTKGVFCEIVDDARKDTERNYYLVIDEINRGNISKIFGELITLIEEDKRGTLEVTLPYSKERFTVPENLYIIGTMNSTDKSIALIDVALRRRFTFLKMAPNAELIEHQKAREVFEELNNFVADQLGEEYRLGHSYFMPISSDEELKFVLQYKIDPLLEEYFYGDNEGLREAREIIGSMTDEATE